MLSFAHLFGEVHFEQAQMSFALVCIIFALYKLQLAEFFRANLTVSALVCIVFADALCFGNTGICNLNLT